VAGQSGRHSRRHTQKRGTAAQRKKCRPSINIQARTQADIGSQANILTRICAETLRHPYRQKGAQTGIQTDTDTYTQRDIHANG